MQKEIDHEEVIEEMRSLLEKKGLSIQDMYFLVKGMEEDLFGEIMGDDDEEPEEDTEEELDGEDLEEEPEEEPTEPKEEKPKIKTKKPKVSTKKEQENV